MAQFITNITDNKVATNTWMADKILPSSFVASSDTSVLTVNLSLTEGTSSLNIDGSVTGGTSYDGPQISFILTYIRGELCANKNIQSETLDKWYLKKVTSPTSYSSTYSNFKTAIYDNISTIYSYSTVNIVPTVNELQYKVINKLIGYDYINLNGASLGLITATALTKRYKVSILNVSFDTNTTNDISGDNVKFVERSGIAYGNNYISYNGTSNTLIPDVANDANKGITTKDYYKLAGLSDASKKCITHNTTSNIVYNDIIPVVGKMYLNGTYTKYANVNDEGLKIYPPKVDSVDVLKSILNSKDLYLDESNFMGVLYSEKKPNKLNYDRELPNIKMSTMRNVKWNTKPFEVSKTSAASSWVDNFTFSMPETHEFFNVGCDDSDNYIIYTATSKVTSYNTSAFGDATIISNEFSNGFGIITFNRPVTSIGVRAFDSCTSLQSITIPDSVTMIGNYAFVNCTALQSIVIPDSVTMIGNYAFGNCNDLQSIVIPNSVASIGVFTFRYCSALQSITIPDSVTYIGDHAFNGCSALRLIECKSITPPSIGNNTFSELPSDFIIVVPAESSDAYKAVWSAYESHIVGTDNYIIYTATEQITPYDLSAFGDATIISNEFSNGIGIITFNRPVTSIGNYAFDSCTSLQSIVIPDSVTSIGNRAFYNCSALQSITIPDSVTSIGNYAFRGCTSLQSITIPDSVTSIGDTAFYNCSALQSIVIPDSVTSIGDTAFSACYALQSIVIPDSVTSIGNQAFFECSALQSITIPDSVTSIGNYAFRGCSALQSIVIPDSVTSIGNQAFSMCTSLQSIVIPDSVTSIGNNAFNNCSTLQSITIPASVTSIGLSAFLNCTSLQSITIPDLVTSIGNYAFNGCSSLQLIECKSTVPPTIGTTVFNNLPENFIIVVPEESLDAYKSDWSTYESHIVGTDNYITYIATSIVIPYNTTAFGDATIISNEFYNGVGIIKFDRKVTSIGTNAFYNCSALSSIIIPDSVTSIGNYAFKNCYNLHSIVIPDLVTSINYQTFYGCVSLRTITIPDSVTSIKNSAFCGCSALKSITIPNSVTSIVYRAFYDCPNLRSITIPDSVTSIENEVFANCTSLELIECKSTALSVGTNVFNNLPGNFIIVVREDRLNAYKTIWSEYSSHITCDRYYIRYKAASKVTPYDASVFGGATISSNLFFIRGENQAGGHDGNGVIIFNKPVTSIGNYAFNNCSTLQSITIPASVTSIGLSAFLNCTSLQSITIPDLVTSIGDNAFNNCYALQSIVIPDSVTSIGISAFLSCSALQSIVIPDSVTSIGPQIFYGCTSLQSIVISDSVTSIGNYAFNNCSTLRTIVIPDSVTSIGVRAFNGCSSLQLIECKSITPPSIGTSVFTGLQSDFIIVVPEESLDAYKAVWSAYESHIVGKYYPKNIKVYDKGSYLNITNIYPGDLIYNTPAYIEPAINMSDNTKDKILYNNLKYMPIGTAKNLYYLSDGTSLSEELVVDEQGRAIIPIETNEKFNPSVISVGDGSTNITLSNKTTGLSPTAYATLTTGSKIDLKIPYSKLTKTEINKLEQLFIDELKLYVIVTYGSTNATNTGINTRNSYINANEFIDEIYLYKYTNGNIALGLSTGKGTISITGSVLPIDDNSPEENTPATTDLNVNVGGNTGGSIGGAGSLNPSLPSLNSYEILYVRMNVVLPISSLNPLFTSQNLLIGGSL